MINDIITEKLLDVQQKLEVFNDPKFTFVAETHTYKREKTKFTSVTTKIAEFVTPFDKEAISRNMAVERVLSGMGCNNLFDLEQSIDEEEVLQIQNELLKAWQHEADYSCELGTATHLWLEEFFGEDTEFTEIKDDNVQKRVDKFIEFYNKKLKNKIFSVGQEIRVFNTKMKIAGTIDAMFLRIRNGKVVLEIWDYKTNKAIHTDENKRYKKLLPPFQNEYENELNKYSIQLNIYKLILASVGIYIDGELVIVHIPQEGEPVIYRCKDYIQELEMYFGVNYYSKLSKVHINNVLDN